MRALATTVLLSAGLLAGCGGSGSSSSSSSTRTATSPAANASGGCRQVSAPPPKGAQHLRAPSMRLSAGRNYTATLQTSCGVIQLALDVRHSPKTTASFAALAGHGFYDGLAFHRIVPGFVIQGGDPLGNGQGGPGYTVVERPPAGTHYTQGAVAMAKTQADPAGASGSQFFIVSGADAGLPADYALLGRVSAGADVVARIGAVAADPQTGQPASPVVIEHVTIAAR